MRTLGAAVLFAGLMFSALPAQAILLDPTPERILFMGYPPSERTLTVKVIRRKQSYGIYAFDSIGPNRLLSRDSFVGIVEGSLLGVGLDARAIALLHEWMAARPNRPPVPQQIGAYYRYYFEQRGWILKVTTTRPYLPTDRAPLPNGLVSQMLAKREVAARLESLSRQMDLEQFRLRGVDDFKRIGR
ncbi:MAG TPA: hypothetical protein V6D05_05725 [Stenomitos sp.]